MGVLATLPQVAWSEVEAPTAGDPSSIRITEWMYNMASDDAGPGEFVELTNVGDEPVDLTGWRYDDDSRSYGAGYDLSGFGVVEPGQAVVLTEAEPGQFRSAWGLCPAAVVIGPYSNNLGRADEINVFDADQELVDRLTFGDQAFPGSIRTNGASGWVSAADLGANDVLEWARSTVGDAEGSVASSHTPPAVGSPTRSTHGGVDPCDEGEPGGEGEAPTITADRSVVIGSVGDPGNPTLDLTVADADSDVADLVVEVTSTNEAVLPAAAVAVTGGGAVRTATFAPAARGTATVTFTVTDPGGGQGTASVGYAASAPAPDPSGRYHHGISDASAALDVGDGHMLLLNDETNTIFLHRQDVTGAPVKTWTFTSAQLGTGDEVDFEGIARSGDRLLLTGSHGNNRSGQVRVERRTFVAATITGSGAGTEVAFAGRYKGLWDDLRAWDAGDGHGLGADALGFAAATAPGVLPNAPDGFNIEGLEHAPDGETAYLGFRAPTIAIDGVEHALVVPVADVDGLFVGGGPAQLGAPILLDLGGRSIRALAGNGSGGYLISAGPTPANDTWALYTWAGDPQHEAELNQVLPAEDALTGGTWEAIATVPDPLQGGGQARLVTDSGDTDFYGTGATKDLAAPFQKSYSQVFTLADVPVDPVDPVDPGPAPTPPTLLDSIGELVAGLLCTLLNPVARLLGLPAPCP